MATERGLSVGFTGTRYDITDSQEDSLSRLLEHLYRNEYFREFHYGDCLGADAAAFDLAKNIGYLTCCHPPTNDSWRAWTVADVILHQREYMVRNRNIVDKSDALIAVPRTQFEIQRSGTWHTVRYAQKLGTPTYVIYPFGVVEARNLGR